MIMTAGQAQNAYYAALGNGQPHYTQTAKRLQGLCGMVHAPAKAGKSSWADSGSRPGSFTAPVLCLDVEVAASWTPSRKIYWDPTRETVPVYDGSWDTCVVLVRDFAVLDTTLQVMNTGRHPFNSISVDSVASIQQRVMLSFAGWYGKMDRDDWGKLLRQTTGVIWGYRDLLTHPTHQVWAVTFVCQTQYDDKRRKWVPALYGSSANAMPYVPDYTGWLYRGQGGQRLMWIGDSDEYETGNRLWGRLPDEMQLGYPGMVQGWTVESAVQQVLASQQ